MTKTYRFEETTESHSTRLGRSRRYTKICRRALLLKLAGLSPQQIQAQMGASNCPYAVAEAGVEDLMAALAVRNGRTRLLVPDPDLAPPRRSEFQEIRQIVGQYYGRQGGKAALARAGVMLGQPYGYRRWGTRTAIVAGLPRQVPHLAVVHDEAVVVRLLFKAYLKGWSFSAIAQDFNYRSIPTRSGRPWNADTLRDMLRNPVYAGYVLYRGAADRNRRDAGTLYPGLHEPIVSWETFRRAQDARALRHPRRPEARWSCPWQNAPAG